MVCNHRLTKFKVWLVVMLSPVLLTSSHQDLEVRRMTTADRTQPLGKSKRMSRDGTGDLKSECKIKRFIRDLSPFNGRTQMPAVLYVIKVILVFFVFKFGAELVGEVVAIAVHFACGKNPLEGEMFDADTIMLLTYFGYSIMIGVIILMWKLFQKKTLAELGFTAKFGSYFIGIAAGTVLITACVVPVMLTGAIRYNGILRNIDIGMVLLMIPCFMFQGAMEEVLCRGVVQNLLTKKTAVPVAVGVSSVLFAIPHLDNMEGGSPAIVFVAIANLILISVLFSLFTIRFKSIWAACGLHSVWNYILFSIMGLNLSGNEGAVASVFDMSSVGSNILNGGMYGIEASIITTAVLAVAAVIFIVINIRKTR